MTTSRQWIAGARPRTLPAALAPVLVGTAVAMWDGGAVWDRALLALVVALALQVGVNYANDYSDGIRGTDAERVGPVRLVGQGLAEPVAVKRAALLSFAVAGVAGLAWCCSAACGGSCSWARRHRRRLALHRRPPPVRLRRARRGVRLRLLRLGRRRRHGVRPAASSARWLASCGVGVGALACAILVVNNLRDIPGDTGRASAPWRCASATRAPAGCTQHWSR